MEDAETSGKLYHWWHKKLADFFSHVENIKRKVEVSPKVTAAVKVNRASLHLLIDIHTHTHKACAARGKLLLPTCYSHH